jgi:hypothetical protein
MEKEMKIDRLLIAKLDELGREILNPIPFYTPAGPKPLSITEQIQRLLRVELSRQAESQGFESFEENDDMEDDEPDDAPVSVYQDEKLMKPEWPGPKERKELAKKADLADLDLEDKTDPEKLKTAPLRNEGDPKKSPSSKAGKEKT